MARHKDKRYFVKYDSEKFDLDKLEEYFKNDAPGVNGVYRHGRFGQHFELLAPDEFEGDGIPYECTCAEFNNPDFCIAHGAASDSDSSKYELRTVLNREDGSLKLQFADEMSGRYFSFDELQGLTPLEACEAQLIFQAGIRYWLARAAFHYLRALYVSRSGDQRKKDDEYDRILDDISTSYKTILKWDRYKVVEMREVSVGTLEVSVPIQSGRKPREETSEQLRERVLKAMVEIEKRSGKITQTNIGSELYSGDDARSNLQARLKRADLRWRDLVAEHKMRKN